MDGIQRIRRGAMAAAGRAGSGNGGAFRLPPAGGGGAGAAEEAGAAAGAAPSVGLGLLALQEERGDSEGRDERARRQGETLLEELRVLQLGLLGGTVDPARLEAMAALAEDGALLAADPGLREAAAAVGLRARIEVARSRRESVGVQG